MELCRARTGVIAVSDVLKQLSKSCAYATRMVLAQPLLTQSFRFLVAIGTVGTTVGRGRKNETTDPRSALLSALSLPLFRQLKLCLGERQPSGGCLDKY